MPVALRLALRDLRGGLRGFSVFLICLALGVAAIAAVGSVRESIRQGLLAEGAVLLGGDAALEFTYRFATEAEKDWMQAQADHVSEMVEFRSMAVVGDERALTQIKGVDGLYPLYGAVALTPDIALDDALSGDRAVMASVLADRLGLSVGQSFRLGTKTFLLSATLDGLPDDAGGGFALGPPILLRTAALKGSGLLQPGTLFETEYRLALPQGTNLQALQTQAEALFRDSGLRWHDRRNGAPGIGQFVDRLGTFLVLVGLAGLAVGGVGVSAAVRSYLEAKVQVIATLKTLGAGAHTIFSIYFIQIGILAALGILAGVVLGALAPIAFAPLIAANLPVPSVAAVYWAPLAEAAVYGVLSALLFTLWPLARTRDVRATSLFRDGAAQVSTLPRPIFLLISAGVFAALVATAAWFSDDPMLAVWAAVGLVGAALLLALVAWGVRRLSRRIARSRALRGRSVARMAFGAIAGHGGEVYSVVLSLGLGLSVLATIGQIDANLRAAISDQLPDVAPSYFVVDIQNAQLDDFLDQTRAHDGVNRVETAPMLRGIITQINGRPAKETAGDHWVLNGDRGVTYAARPPANTVVTQGAWWGDEYSGPPQISFAAEQGAEMGLTLGDMLTVNILGRDITAEITSFREVDFSTAGIGFILSLNPGALAGAPHTHIATVYADEVAEAPLMRDLAQTYPNITAIRVRDAIARVADVMRGLAAAITYGALATLVTGGFVLIGTAAAGARARIYETAILKTLGATRGRILRYLALRAGIMGAAAGAVAVLAGALAGWAVMTFLLDVDYQFEPLSAVLIVAAGVLATVLAGLAFAWGPLTRRPAGVLRVRD